MGYGLSWWTHTASPAKAEQYWVERLCRLQAAIGPRCAGRPLDGFDYVAPRVIRSRWGDLEIVANLSGEPWKVDEQTTVAPEGFVARSPSLEAGVFARYGGKDCPAGGMWLIRERGAAGWAEWSAGAETPGR
jgi:hypothetical protein